VSVYETEEQQIETLRRWWKLYGTTVVISVLLTIAAIFGWRYWQMRELRIASEASLGYEHMISGIVQKDTDLVKRQANHLMKEYSRTPYASLAALTLAKQAVVNKQYNKANNHLQWVINNSPVPSLKQTARIRFARVLLSQKKNSKALNILAKVDDKNFLGEILEVQGDIFSAEGKAVQAKKAYEQAIAELEKTDTVRPILQMKLENT